MSSTPPQHRLHTFHFDFDFYLRDFFLNTEIENYRKKEKKKVFFQREIVNRHHADAI